MNLLRLIETDEARVDENSLTVRQQLFLRKIRLHDQGIFVSRAMGKLMFNGPLIGSGLMPPKDLD